MRAIPALLAMALLAGCAGLSPRGPATPVTAAHQPASGGAPARPAPAADDSAPSAEALTVLATIPEPLPPGERVPAPAPAAVAAPPAVPAAPGPAVPASPGSAVGLGAAGSAATAARAAGDTTASPSDSTAAAPPDSGAAGQADSAGVGVPVPEPTVPLGERPGGGGAAIVEGTLVPKAMAPAAAARPDTCWRIQIGAPPEQPKAQALMDLATSQLLTPFVIELDRKRYKVRSRDCMERAAANALRERAQRTGFEGAFVIKAPAQGRQP
jgi:hypothetical protein